jgi:hypothetical protein
MNVIVFPHQGLGDQFVMNGYINYLILEYNVKNIILVAKEYQRDTLEHLYKDSPEVSFYFLPNINETSGNDDPLFIKNIDKKPFNSITMIDTEKYYIHSFGFHSDRGLSPIAGISWADYFYLCANVNPSLRYRMFKLPNDMERSKANYESLKGYLNSEQYIIIHDDPSRNRYLHADLIHSILKKNNTTLLPIIYLGKNRNKYPFFEGLNNKEFPESLNSSSLLDLYHIIYNATECHFMDSSIACLTDTMTDSSSKLYIHYYIPHGDTPNRFNEAHSNRSWVPLYRSSLNNV